MKKLTSKTLDSVIANIKALPATDRNIILTRWNAVLNELRDDDFFGTEGQCDPRGDPRK